MPRVKKQRIDTIYTIGRRKRSVARVRFYSDKGQSLVNDQPLDVFFKDINPSVYMRPFDLTGTNGKCYITVRVVGGGKSGQMGAFLHGISRALVKADEKNRKILRLNGLLTRDPRERERRKPGLMGARAGKQSPKR